MCISNDRSDILLLALTALTVELRFCILEVIQGMVKEQGSCCELCKADMDWEGTSQVPELGFLCQLAIPAACPGACWQRKFPVLSTCNVTLITQWGEQKRGHWSHFLPLVVFLSFLAPAFFSLTIKFRPCQQKKTNKKSKERSFLSIPAAHEA